MGFVQVDPADLRRIASVLDEVHGDYGSLSRRLDDRMPAMPFGVYARVRAEIDHASWTLTRRAGELPPVRDDLHRRAAWAELVSDFTAATRVTTARVEHFPLRKLIESWRHARLHWPAPLKPGKHVQQPSAAKKKPGHSSRLAMSAANAAAVAAAAAVALSRQIAVQAFVKKYSGKGVNVDGAYGNQCWDLAAKYSQEVAGVPASQHYGLPTGPNHSAAEVFTNFASPLPKYYDRIPYVPGQLPQPGDLVVWSADTPYSGGSGHIAIVTSVDPNGKSFVSFDQNSPVGSLPHERSHDYGHVLGFLRPKQAV